LDSLPKTSYVRQDAAALFSHGKQKRVFPNIIYKSGKYNYIGADRLRKS
jgi:hypothetical protein